MSPSIKVLFLLIFIYFIYLTFKLFENPEKDTKIIKSEIPVLNHNPVLYQNKIMKYIKIYNKELKKNFKVKSKFKKPKKGLFALKNFNKNDILLYVTGDVVTINEINDYEKIFPKTRKTRISTSNNFFFINPTKDSRWGKLIIN
jgi:hypothetical protein